MSFSQAAGTAIIPTLSRIVLALAFVTAGYNKVFSTGTFNPQDTAALKSLGVTVVPLDASAADVARIERASLTLQQTAPMPAEEPEQPSQTEGSDESPEAMDQDAPAGEPMPPAETQVPDERGKAAKLHHVTLLCHGASLPYPVVLAWIAALTELVGGVLLFFGFLSRIWGLGLAINMGVAVYLTTWGPYLDVGPLNVASGPDFSLFNMFFVQLALFVLAFGIFLTGPGPVSLDRLLFGGPRHANAAKHSEKDGG